MPDRKKAASFINDNSFILIDSGTTCAYIADYIDAKNLIVLTNGINMIKPLLKKHCDVSVPPGQIKELSSTYIDFVQDLEYLDRFTFDLAFLGTNSINQSTAIASRDASHCAILKKMVSRSKKTYICADSSKFGILNRYTFATAQDVTIITDKEPPEGYEDYDVIIAD